MQPFTVHQRRTDNALREVEARLEALEERLSAVVAGIELGTVPTRETLYLGRPFVYPSDSKIGEAIGGGGEWDAGLRTIVAELLSETDEPTICDVGANIGASLLQMLAAKPSARVVAFEPSGRFRFFLERNLELAGFDRVEVWPLLVGKEPGSRWLYSNDTTATVLTERLPDGYEARGKQFVDMTTLDELFRDRKAVDFIKIDTDGFDFEVLRGAEGILKRDRPVLRFEVAPILPASPEPAPPEEADWAAAWAAAGDDLAWLQSMGYRRLVCSSPTGGLVETTEDPAQAVRWAQEVECPHFDVLTSPKGSPSEARLREIALASRFS